MCSSLPAKTNIPSDGAVSLIDSAFTPQLADGEPEYARLWRYMLTFGLDGEFCGGMGDTSELGECVCSEGGISTTEVILVVALVVFLLAALGVAIFMIHRKNKKSGW